MTAPVTPLQLAAMRAIRAHEQEFGRGITPATLHHAVGCQPDQMLRTLESKRWAERDEEGWWLTDDGLDVLEASGDAPPPVTGLYQWRNRREPQPLTPVQIATLLGIDEHWREHGRGITRHALTERVGRTGVRHSTKTLRDRGLIERHPSAKRSRIIWLLALTEAGQLEVDRIRGVEAAE